MEGKKEESANSRISLAHLTFEEAVTALVRDEAPKRMDSQAGESCSTKADDPGVAPFREMNRSTSAIFRRFRRKSNSLK